MSLNPDKLAYNIAEAQAAIGVKRTKMLALLRDGEVACFYMGARRYIRADVLAGYIDRVSQAAPQPAAQAAA